MEHMPVLSVVVLPEQLHAAQPWSLHPQAPGGGLKTSAQQWATAGDTRPASRKLDWTELVFDMEILSSGLHLGPAGDKIGPFPWQDRWRWGIGKSRGNPLNFYIINKAYHGTPSFCVGLRKFLFLWHLKNFTSMGNRDCSFGCNVYIYKYLFNEYTFISVLEFKLTILEQLRVKK